MGLLTFLGSALGFIIMVVVMLALVVAGFFIWLYYRARRGITNASRKFRGNDQKQDFQQTRRAPPQNKPNEILEVELLEVIDVEPEDKKSE